VIANSETCLIKGRYKWVASPTNVFRFF